MRRSRGRRLAQLTSDTVCNAQVLLEWANRRDIRSEKVSIAEFMFEDPTGAYSYVHVHICMHVYTYVHVCIHAYACIHHVYIYMHLYLSKDLALCEWSNRRGNRSEKVSIAAFMFEDPTGAYIYYMRVCIYMHVYMYTHT
jgi:hypothetical protein